MSNICFQFLPKSFIAFGPVVSYTAWYQLGKQLAKQLVKGKVNP